MASELSPYSIEGNLRQQWPNIIEDYLITLDRDRYKALNQAAINFKMLRDTVVNWLSGATFPDAPTFVFAMHTMKKAICMHATYGALIIDEDTTSNTSKLKN